MKTSQKIWGLAILGSLMACGGTDDTRVPYEGCFQKYPVRVCAKVSACNAASAPNVRCL
jgi:hypothetical protein